MVSIVAIAVVGYIVAFLPARLTHPDIGRFRRTLWTGIGHRDRRLRSVRVSYAAFGWPSLVVAIAWRTSKTRAGLVELRAQMRAAEHRISGGHPTRRGLRGADHRSAGGRAGCEERSAPGPRPVNGNR